MVLSPNNEPSQSPAPPTSPTRAKTPIIDKSPAMQNKRKKMMQDLIRNGVFEKVTVPGTLPRLWVTPSFYLLDFDTKQSFVSVVYAYYFDGTSYGDVVLIYDNLSGKEVGKYSTVQGLNMK